MSFKMPHFPKTTTSTPTTYQNSPSDTVNGNSNSNNNSNNNNNNHKNDPVDYSIMTDNTSKDMSFNLDNSSHSLNGGTRNPSIMQSSVSGPSSFKEMKKSYELKKKYFTKNIYSALETTAEVHSGWLKARTSFKRWTKVWCQVKPGYLILYSSQEAQKKHRLGVVLISICQAIQRPSKKEGFCFKMINPFGCSVWAKSSTRAFTFPHSSLMLRASDKIIGKLWLDALERCNLSANLDANRFPPGHLVGDREVDFSDSDDANSTTNRQLASLALSNNKNNNHIYHSNSSSNNNSMTSLNRPKACSGDPFYSAGNSEHQWVDLSSQKNNIMDDLYNNNNTHPQHQYSLARSSQHHRPSSQMSNRSSLRREVCASNMPRSTSSQNIRTTSNMDDGLTHTNTITSASSSKMVAKFNKYNWRDLQLEGVKYFEDGCEALGSSGVQTEEVQEGNKNFLWHIIKQLRPGMDLSKVTLPTFILEPRSFLEKLADHYYHCDILSEAVLINDPVARLSTIVKWYLSGFYKKPDGPKKPYNPLLGERFRCFWDHPKTQSRTFFVAEQVSHHPPISAFYVTNKKDGFSISCSLLSRSKFTGNSVSAIMDGTAQLTLNNRNETYTLTMPHANCRGILVGSLCLELGGKVEIECAQTGCKCELDFKLASPVWASVNSYNTLTGKISKFGKLTHTLEGHWDKKITMLDKATGDRSVFWEVTESITESRLKRYSVSYLDQEDRESVKLWAKVTEALKAGDQVAATNEKTRLEDMQRQEARERQGQFKPVCFFGGYGGTGSVGGGHEYRYRWLDTRLWDERVDIMQFENQFKIQTLVCNNNNHEPFNYHEPSIDVPLSEFLAKNSGEHRHQNRSLTPSPSVHKLAEAIADEVTGKTTDQLISEAIEKVANKNRLLEEDVAKLKRFKKIGGLVLVAIFAIVMAVFLKTK